MKDSKIKIAVTTTNYKTVDQHFGKASGFSIYEIKAGNINYLETRKTIPYCQGGDQLPETDGHAFSEERLNRIYETIKDCRILYTRQIGEKPGAALFSRGIEIKPCTCKIEQIAGCSGNCK
jgi:predicted Fe-Mo cluster-binding NifX family protein